MPAGDREQLIRGSPTRLSRDTPRVLPRHRAPGGFPGKAQMTRQEAPATGSAARGRGTRKGDFRMLAQRGHQIVPPLGGAAQTRAETLALGSGHCWPRNQMTPLCRAFRSGRKLGSNQRPPACETAGPTTSERPFRNKRLQKRLQSGSSARGMRRSRSCKPRRGAASREGDRRDSNPRPPGPQPGALPAELRPPRASNDSAAPEAQTGRRQL